MKAYETGKIKNVLLAGHGGSGKTSLAEAVLYYSGGTDRLGKTSEGNTVLDSDPEEIKRKVSLSLAVAPVLHKDYKINLLDAPGSFDFLAGLYEGMQACETVVIVLSGKSGVTPGAEIAYELAKKQGKSVAFFVSKLDNERSDYYKVLDQLKSFFGQSVCPMLLPCVENRQVVGYMDVIRKQGLRFGEKGKAENAELAGMEQAAEEAYAAISEAIAETDDALMDKFFSGETFTEAEILSGVKAGITAGVLHPVFCGSGTTLAGISFLCDAAADFFPGPADMGKAAAQNQQGEPVELDCNAGDPLAAYVFKTVADPFIGKLSFIKVLAGTLRADAQPINARTGEPERIGKMIILKGKKQEDAKEAAAGDIAVLAKLGDVGTGDTLCDPKRVISAAMIRFPHPCMEMAVRPKSKGDEGKLSQNIQRLCEEDPTLSYAINHETHEQVLAGLGDQHLDVAIAKLKSKFGLDVELSVPIVPYRETIRKKIKVEGKHKKQTGGHGQYGDVWIEFEPHGGEDLLFEEKVFGGAVPRGFFPAVEKGLRDSIKHGIVAGYPVVGLKATLVDGSYHPVDSSEMSFKMAASAAFKTAMPQASPVLLEPIGLLKATLPENNTGDLMGDINKRRGRILGMNPAGSKLQLIEAEVPMSEMHDFTTVLRAMTQGRGVFTFDFVRYEQLPANLEKEVIEKAPKREENI